MEFLAQIIPADTVYTLPVSQFFVSAQPYEIVDFLIYFMTYIYEFENEPYRWFIGDPIDIEIEDEPFHDIIDFWNVLINSDPEVFGDHGQPQMVIYYNYDEGVYVVSIIDHSGSLIGHTPTTIEEETVFTAYLNGEEIRDFLYLVYPKIYNVNAENIL